MVGVCDAGKKKRPRVSNSGLVRSVWCPPWTTHRYTRLNFTESTPVHPHRHPAGHPALDDQQRAPSGAVQMVSACASPGERSNRFVRSSRGPEVLRGHSQQTEEVRQEPRGVGSSSMRLSIRHFRKLRRGEYRGCNGPATSVKQHKSQAGALLARWVTPLPPRDSAKEGQGGRSMTSSRESQRNARRRDDFRRADGNRRVAQTIEAARRLDDSEPHRPRGEHHQARKRAQ
jgi:hypothetical protein